MLRSFKFSSDKLSDEAESTSLTPSQILEDIKIVEQEPISFQTDFEGIMEMYSDQDTVNAYMNDHQGWFVRCASPMRAEPFGENGYTLVVGSYGAFGYQVDPQMSVVLESPQLGSYAMYSVDNPEFNHLGYEVDYRSEMEIKPISVDEAAQGIDRVFQQHSFPTLPDSITRINWQLHLEVKVKFPSFIYRLPKSLIAKTGDRLLTEIIKQVSPHLSYKVQKDFHTRFNLPIPPKTARTCEQVKP